MTINKELKSDAILQQEQEKMLQVLAINDLSEKSLRTFFAVMSLIDPNGSGPLPCVRVNEHGLSMVLNTSLKNVSNQTSIMKAELQARETRRKSKVKGGYKRYRWFERIWKSRSNGLTVFEFHKDINRYLKDLASYFSPIAPLYVAGFSSKYSFRLYHFLRILHPYNQTVAGNMVSVHDIDYQTLRDMLGVDSNRYQKFSKFRVDVLQTIQDELELSDVTFRFEAPEREQEPMGKISYLRVTITTKNIEQLVGTDGMVEWYLKLLVPEWSSKYLETYSDEVIRTNLIFALTEYAKYRHQYFFTTQSLVHDMITRDYAKYWEVLDPKQYIDKPEHKFVVNYLLYIWDKLSDKDRRDFAKYRFSRGIVAELYKGPKNVLYNF